MISVTRHNSGTNHRNGKWQVLWRTRGDLNFCDEATSGTNHRNVSAQEFPIFRNFPWQLCSGGPKVGDPWGHPSLASRAVFENAETLRLLFSEPIWVGRRVVTGEHCTGSPNKSIDQIGKNCPKNVRKLCFQPFRRSLDIFRTFCRHSLLILRFILICSDFPDFFRFVQIKFCAPCFRKCPDFWFVLICSAFLRFVPISVFRRNQNKSGKPLSADPFCKSPIFRAPKKLQVFCGFSANIAGKLRVCNSPWENQEFFCDCDFGDAKFYPRLF